MASSCFTSDWSRRSYIWCPPPPPCNWKNRTIWTGDNLDIMRGMNSESVDLIYLDPPFNSNANYAAPIGSQAAGAAFKDTWGLDDINLAWHGEIKHEYPGLYELLNTTRATHGDSMMSYLIYIAIRLIEMKRLLKPTGSIYLHCDPTASHYLKLLMDSVFGRTSYRNEIVWKRTSAHALEHRTYSKITDRILYYSVSNKPIWNPPYDEYSKEYIKSAFRYSDKHGEYGIGDLTGGKAGSEYAYLPFGGASPSSGRAWAPPPREKFPPSARALIPKSYEDMDALEKCKALDEAGLIYWSKNRKPSYKKYLTTMKGIPAADLILNIPPVKGKEATCYPTQKPLKLLRRIICASSNTGDMVLDPFAGCATACVAAEIERRQWVGIDISPKAADLVRERTRKELGMIFKVHHRVDIPERTDLGRIIPYNSSANKKWLYGEQGGYCNGCEHHFEVRNMEVDHIIPRSKGGTDHISNLQLLCPACNSLKGTKTHEELLAMLTNKGWIKEKKAA